MSEVLSRALTMVTSGGTSASIFRTHSVLARYEAIRGIRLKAHEQSLGAACVGSLGAASTPPVGKWIFMDQSGCRWLSFHKPVHRFIRHQQAGGTATSGDVRRIRTSPSDAPRGSARG